MINNQHDNKDFIPYLDLSINIDKYEILKIYEINESILLQYLINIHLINTIL